MFFLSGINSILPVVIYISLVWICVIIGCGNTLQGFSKSFSTSTKIIKHSTVQKSGKNYILEAERGKINKKGHLIQENKYTASGQAYVSAFAMHRVKYASLNKILSYQHYFPIHNYRGPPSVLF